MSRANLKPYREKDNTRSSAVLVSALVQALAPMEKACAVAVSVVHPIILLGVAIDQMRKGEGWSCDQPLAFYVVLSSVVYIISAFAWSMVVPTSDYCGRVAKCKCFFILPLFVLSLILTVYGVVLWHDASIYVVPSNACREQSLMIACYPCSNAYIIDTQNLTMRIFIASFFLSAALPLVILLFSLCGAGSRCASPEIPSEDCADVRCHQQADGCWCWCLHKCSLIVGRRVLSRQNTT